MHKQDGKTFANFTGHRVRLHTHAGPQGQLELWEILVFWFESS
jgi:hypothetical protein